MSTAPVAVIAGSGGGGSATAASLAAAGFVVVVLDRRAEKAQAVVDTLDNAPAEAHGVDLGDLAAVQSLGDDVIARHGRVDVLVHLVGGWRGSPSLDHSAVENWQALHPPIVGTLTVLTAVLGDAIRQSPRGRIFMITSTTAAAPAVGNIAYAAAKRAAEGWMAGIADYFHDSPAAAVTMAVKALLTDDMVAAEPDKSWSGYTHVRDLASAIAALCTGDAVNGSRVDLPIDEATAT